MLVQSGNDLEGLKIMISAEPANLSLVRPVRGAHSLARSVLSGRLGLDHSRCDRFRLREMCSFSAARSQIVAERTSRGRDIEILAWASLESLNCLDLVRADRIGAWLQVQYDWEKRELTGLRCRGSVYENLSIRGAGKRISLKTERDFMKAARPVGLSGLGTLRFPLLERSETRGRLAMMSFELEAGPLSGRFEFAEIEVRMTVEEPPDKTGRPGA